MVAQRHLSHYLDVGLKNVDSFETVGRRGEKDMWGDEMNVMILVSVKQGSLPLKHLLK